MIVETQNSWHAIDRHFDFTPNREAARARAEKYVNEVKAKREALSGRTLTTLKDLTVAPPKQDARTPQERSKARMALPFVPVPKTPAPVEANPFKRTAAEFIGKEDKRSVREQMNDKLAAEWDAKHAQQQAADDFANDPKRKKLIALAEAQLETVAWGAEFTTDQLQAAEATLYQCKNGCLDHGAKLVQQFTADRKADAEAKIGAARTKYEALIGEELVPEAPTPTQPRQYVFYSSERIAGERDPVRQQEMQASTDAWMSWKLSQPVEQ